MSKASRLARPSSAGAGSKLPSPRKEYQGSARARVVTVGEKLMRAGSDVVLSRQKSVTVAPSQEKSQSESSAESQASKKSPDEKSKHVDTVSPRSRISTPKASSHSQGSMHKQSKSNLKVTSPEDAEHISRRQASPNGTPSSKGDAKGSCTVPRRHTLGGPRSSREILAMQPSDMDKKREAFLEHLKYKYPHHASAIMGHQERLREQSLQAMLFSLHSTLDIQRYLMSIQLPHNRGRSPKHGPIPHPGLGDQVDHLSLVSLESLDAMSEGDIPTGFTRGSRIRASLPVVRSTNQTKDRSLGVLYLQYGDETKQIRMPNEITSVDTIRALFVSAFPQHLTMKMLESPNVAVYVKDDMRNMYYELADVRNIADHSCLKVYHKDPAQAFSHGPRPTNGDARMHNEMAHASREAQHPLRHPPMGPPAHHPMQGVLPPAGHSMPPSPSRIPFGPRQGPGHGNATMPRDRISNATPPARSVSPCSSAILERRDVKPDENMGGKGHSLTRGNEGLYADPYLLQEGRLSMAGAHGPHPDEHGIGGFHRASIRSTSSYSGPSPTDTIDHPSLYRQKSRNSQLPTLGSKTPPPSPHRMTEVRMIDIHGGPPHGMPPHSVPMERNSPVRQSFRKEEVVGTKPRNNMGSPVVADLQGHLQGPIPVPGDHQTRERPSKTSSPVHSAHSSGGSPVLAPKSAAAPADKNSVPVKVNFLQFRKNVSDLRMQLHQMKQLQLQNQEALRVQLKRAEQEISVKLAESMRRLEDPVQKQRTLVDEDRNKYLGLEEHVLTQLGDLEQYVHALQKDSAAAHRQVTLKDVEEGAVTLRKVGESLAGLKGEFPALQTRMRAVLRVEVEAVKFLKEEPHKLDTMLKRVKSLTDSLSSLRRFATENCQKGSDSPTPVAVDNSPAVAATETHRESPPASVPPSSSSSSTTPEPQNSTLRSEVMSSSPVVVHHVQSAPVHVQQSRQSAALSTQPSPPLTPSPTQGSSPNLGKSQEPPKETTSKAESPTRHKKTNGNPLNNGNGNQDLVIGELQTIKDKSKSRAMSIEAAEKEWEERRLNMGQYDGKEFEKLLLEAQVNMMKGIPSLEVEENTTLSPAATVEKEEISSDGASPSEPQSGLPSDKPSKKVPEKLPKPVMEKPTKLLMDRPSKINSKPQAPEGLMKQAPEKSNKSPPPPPPRKTYNSSGITTTRSGEVVFTNRRESLSAQEADEEAPPTSPQPKPTKVAPETKPMPVTPPPVNAVDAHEEEDEGDKIMAELQQSSELKREDKVPETDENGNTTLRQSQGVIYYVTGQIPKDQQPPLGTEDTHEHKDSTQSSTQVSNVNVNDNSPSQQHHQQQQPPQSPPPKSPVTPPPISPKPVGLSGFKLPKKKVPVKRPDSLKTSTEMQKGKIKLITEKKNKVDQEQVTPCKNAAPEPVLTKTVVAVKESANPTVTLQKTHSIVVSNLSNTEEIEEGAGLSPDLPEEEAPPPPDNIAFMITNTKVQALSCGEYQELVNAKKGSVQTVTVGNAVNRGNATSDPSLPQDYGFNRKPVIIIFDEPMDIRSAYKRLSTIFECEEELDRMLSEERIDEESEESDTERSGGLTVKAEKDKKHGGKKVRCSEGASDQASLSSTSSSSSELLDSGVNLESNGDAKQEGKKKFKFKFPKKQLAALTQAIRSGPKSGKKTLQVVVYEDEEESDGTVKQHKEAKRFEIKRSKSLAENPKGNGSSLLKRQSSEAVCRTDEIRKSTYKTLDSLEQTIKQLETTISEMGPLSPEESVSTEEAKTGNGKLPEGVGLKRSSSLPASKGPSPKVPSRSSLQKKTKPQLLPRPVIIPSTNTTNTVPSVPSTVQQNTSVASPTSRMPVPLSAKSRQSPGTTDKAGKQQKLQDAQRQFRQANGSAKRLGDHKTTSPTIPTSKIPAFYPSSTKGNSQSAQNSDATNPINPSTSSVTKSSTLSSPVARSGSLPSSFLPSLSNGSLKHPTPSQHTGKAIPFSSQTQNGRVHSSSSSSSSSSPSPLSPTPLGPGGKSIRTIHTPSFTSYRSHNGSNGKSCIPTATAAKDTT
ncbi:sickle tail protein homolog isoform X4 [Gouania willdenowi]|uniref:sickle tail protein homolog isoform X4 n=1 Tax=Gouania willdenowi TaxID=441366 RepID=UPI00105484FF|nr:sickle tail protein homolog isoform X4 [Gouania willdenowi]